MSTERKDATERYRIFICNFRMAQYICVPRKRRWTSQTISSWGATSTSKKTEQSRKHSFSQKIRNSTKIEADATKDPAVEQKLQQLSSSLTHLLNETISGTNDTLAQQIPQARRRKRGLGRRGGSIDWWYGNWCGPKQGGYTNNPKPICKYFCYRSTSYVNRACCDCLPPRDGLDEACMEHDR